MYSPYQKNIATPVPVPVRFLTSHRRDNKKLIQKRCCSATMLLWWCLGTSSRAVPGGGSTGIDLTNLQKTKRHDYITNFETMSKVSKTGAYLKHPTHFSRHHWPIAGMHHLRAAEVGVHLANSNVEG